MKLKNTLFVDFLKSLFSSQGEVSSKRVVGFGCFLLLAEIVQGSIWFNKNVPNELLLAIVTILIACFGLNTALDFKALGTRSKIASDIVKEQPEPDTADDAKEVLNTPNKSN